MSKKVVGLIGLPVQAKRANLLYKDIAKRANVTPEYVSGLANGRRTPSLPLSIEIANM